MIIWTFVFQDQNKNVPGSVLLAFSNITLSRCETQNSVLDEGLQELQSDYKEARAHTGTKARVTRIVRARQFGADKKVRASENEIVQIETELSWGLQLSLPIVSEQRDLPMQGNARGITSLVGTSRGTRRPRRDRPGLLHMQLNNGVAVI